MTFSWGILGRDFWLYRFGQVISIIGDSCGFIALTWWVLEKTESAAVLATILAPAMFMRIFLLPLFGPIGDRFSRKWVAVIGDVWRGILCLIISFLMYFDIFHLPSIVFIYIVFGIGSALFASVHSSIVPQLVSKENLGKAMQQEQAITAFGNVVGGLIGGLIVTFIGLWGSFLFDALSFALAAYATAAIRANTSSLSGGSKPALTLGRWFLSLKDGVRVVTQIPFLLWLGVLGGVLNLFTAPFGLILPVLVKEVRHMPPWFLGALQSSISVGMIIGALSVSKIIKHMRTDYVACAGLVVAGIGFASLPLMPNLMMPLSLMFFLGFGLMMINIPTNTQYALAVPNDYRSRVDSCLGFLNMSASPIGTALAGSLITIYGVKWTLLGSGIIVILISPFLFAIPHFSKFMRMKPEEAQRFFVDNYPQVFK